MAVPYIVQYAPARQVRQKSLLNFTNFITFLHRFYRVPYEKANVLTRFGSTADGYVPTLLKKTLVVKVLTQS